MRGHGVDRAVGSGPSLQQGGIQMKVKWIFRFVALVAVLGLTIVATSADEGTLSLRAKLTGFQESPPKLSASTEYSRQGGRLGEVPPAFVRGGRDRRFCGVRHWRAGGWWGLGGGWCPRRHNQMFRVSNPAGGVSRRSHAM